jgi:hypothetical protein
LKALKSDVGELVPGLSVPEIEGPTVLIGHVTTPRSSITVGCFLMVNPVTVLGTEGEGAIPTFSIDTSTKIPVYLVGPAKAQQGDNLICRRVDYRFVAERQSTKGSILTTTPGCPCASGPQTIFMTATGSGAGYYNPRDELLAREDDV